MYGPMAIFLNWANQGLPTVACHSLTNIGIPMAYDLWSNGNISQLGQAGLANSGMPLSNQYWYSNGLQHMVQWQYFLIGASRACQQVHATL